jgi:hypothetical protein
MFKKELNFKKEKFQKCKPNLFLDEKSLKKSLHSRRKRLLHKFCSCFQIHLREKTKKCTTFDEKSFKKKSNFILQSYIAQIYFNRSSKRNFLFLFAKVSPALLG